MAATKLVKAKAGQNKKYHALSVINQILPHLLKELDLRFPGQAFVMTGMDTKTFRDDHGVAKDYDASSAAHWKFNRYWIFQSTASISATMTASASNPRPSDLSSGWPGCSKEPPEAHGPERTKPP